MHLCSGAPATRLRRWPTEFTRLEFARLCPEPRRSNPRLLEPPEAPPGAPASWHPRQHASAHIPAPLAPFWASPRHTHYAHAHSMPKISVTAGPLLLMLFLLASSPTVTATAPSSLCEQHICCDSLGEQCSNGATCECVSAKEEGQRRLLFGSIPGCALTAIRT